MWLGSISSVKHAVAGSHDWFILLAAVGITASVSDIRVCQCKDGSNLVQIDSYTGVSY